MKRMPLMRIPLQFEASPTSHMGAEVKNFDLKNLTPEEAANIREKVYQHKLIVFRAQTLTNEQYINLAKTIGRPQIYFQPNYHHPEHEEIFVSSNVPENGKKIGVAGTGRYWHTDYQFFPEPLPMTMLQPKILPLTRRETYYIDLELVNKKLPDSLRQYVADRRAVHEAKWRYKITPADIDRAIIDIVKEFEALTPPAFHPTVIQHPVTGKELLYLSRGFTTGIEGFSYEENKRILPELFDFIERPEHVYTHRWEPGDILLWDNRSLLHRAGDTPPGEQSVSYRIGIYDDVPFYVNAATSPTS